MAAMHFKQVQRFILAKKKSGGLGALQSFNNFDRGIGMWKLV